MAANYHDSRLSYSNLEAISSEHNHSSLQMGHGVEVVQQDVYHGIQVVSNENDKIYIHPGSTAPEVSGEDGSLPQIPRRTICGIGRKRFWVVVGLVGGFIIFAAAIGGGVGGFLANRSKSESQTSSSPAASTASTGTSTRSPPPPTPTRAPFQNLSIAALRWVDRDSISHYRVYTQSSNSSQPRLLESARDRADGAWTVSSITDVNIDTVQPGTPLSVSAGYPHTNSSIDLVKSVFYLQPGGTIIERQSPYKTTEGVWGNDNFSGLYTTSNASSLFSYWYQDLGRHFQVLATFFQELGANELTVGRYIENGTNDGLPWSSSRKSISIQDGSPIAAVAAGSGLNLRLYVGGTDGTIKQYAYDLEEDVLGSVVNTALSISPRTPFCVTIEDNRNWYTTATLPECTRTSADTGVFFTHLLLYASADRQTLSLVSWNCSSGFVDAQNRIEKLLQPNRTYLGLATTSASNLTFSDQRVYVLFDEGSGPQVEEWQIPASGGLDVGRQNGPWELVGKVPIHI